MQKKRKAEEVDSGREAIESSSSENVDSGSEGKEIAQSSSDEEEGKKIEDSDEEEVKGEPTNSYRDPSLDMETNLQNTPCFYCGEKGHSHSSCTLGTKDQLCFACGENDHISKDCPILPTMPFCVRCGDSSHSTPTCTSTLPLRGETTITCNACGLKQHPGGVCKEELYPGNFRILIDRQYYTASTQYNAAKRYIERDLEKKYNFSLVDIRRERFAASNPEGVEAEKTELEEKPKPEEPKPKMTMSVVFE